MKTNNEVYFDNAATTKVYDEVIDVMSQSLKEDYFNPSAFYKPAVDVEKKIEEARKDLANILSFNPDEIYFTSGATESNNTVIKGIIESSRKPFNIITSQIEHPSVMEPFKHYENKGIETRYIPVDAMGNLDLEWLKENVDENTRLVSIMAVNNEIGTILDLIKAKEIVKAQNPKTIFHTDYTQAFLKTKDSRIDLTKLKPDILSCTAHKIHGPKGIGLLALRKDIKLNPLIHGGGQEKNMRSGTENISGILGFATASNLLNEKQEKTENDLKILKDYMTDRIINEIDGVIVNTPENSISSLLSLSIKNIRSEVLLHMLESKKIFISAGSACSTHHKDSYVHKALGYDKNRSEGTIRISLSEFNTKEEVDYFVDELTKKVKELRKLLGLKK